MARARTERSPGDCEADAVQEGSQRADGLMLCVEVQAIDGVTVCAGEDASLLTMMWRTRFE